jgi:hypothetical protein
MKTHLNLYQIALAPRQGAQRRSPRSALSLPLHPRLQLQLQPQPPPHRCDADDVNNAQRNEQRGFFSSITSDKRQYLRRSFCALLAATTLTACGSSLPPGTGVVLDREKKPVAGVHVLVWREYMPLQPWWSTIFAFVDSRSNQSFQCYGQHYELTDAQGRFTIPAGTIERP